MYLTIILVVFIVGYLAITLEHAIKVNKAASALLTGVLCWVLYIMGSGNTELVDEQLAHHLGEIAGILFFLLGAMTVVELIDAHDGFEVIISQIRTNDKRKLLWVIGMVTFFLSAALDNLTTAIVMVSLLRKLLQDRSDRMMFLGVVIIAANAGGAWSPIGDVTTTMLWIEGQITSGGVITSLFFPSLACLLVPLTIASVYVKGQFARPVASGEEKLMDTSVYERNIVFIAGIGVLIFVPVFKTITHLPPFMGMLFGLGVLWVITEMIHSGKDEEDKHVYSVVHALRKIDTPSVLFFLGILVSIAALQSTGQLRELAEFLASALPNENVIVLCIGLLSAVVDNVPLVAGAMGMYDLTQYPVDSNFWLFLAYCAGTGGSALIIGSAAGVAVMGMEKIDFFWYVKRISLLALAGYLAGAGVYLLIY
jgi:Na+/H+ antiporter NhaD/arsenite permease-like protein